MTYVALIRGINVGGKNKIDMRSLASAFERAGMTRVSTYINSGNVIFQHDSKRPRELAERLEQAIETEFGFRVKVLLRDADNLAALAKALPKSWANNQSAKCDVMFLADDVDNPEILERLTIKPDIDDVKYAPGAVLWRVDRPKVTRSGMMRIVGTDLYQQMTVRNCNTLRKLADLVQLADEQR